MQAKHIVILLITAFSFFFCGKLISGCVQAPPYEPVRTTSNEQINDNLQQMELLTTDLPYLLLFLIIPIVSVGLLFLKLKTIAGVIINILLTINTIVFLIPAAILYLNLNPSGHGIEFLYYLFLFPVCGFILVALATLKIVFYLHRKK